MYAPRPLQFVILVGIPLLVVSDVYEYLSTMKDVNNPPPTATWSPQTTGETRPSNGASANLFALPALLNPSAVAFGDYRIGNASPVHTVYLVNLGPARLTVARITVTGPAAQDFTARTTCLGHTTSAYGGCTIDIRFMPHAAGVRRAQLVIRANRKVSSRSIPLSGHARS